ncbi:MAG: BolA/IbaG family iron-sulfur metabolism protein [Pseudomonadota bacterium]|jgi:stress-induced morphogen
MPILKSDLEHILKTAFPEGDVIVKDLRNDNDHYSIDIKCASFHNLSRIQQHQRVYNALKECNIHALSIKTHSI